MVNRRRFVSAAAATVVAAAVPAFATPARARRSRGPRGLSASWWRRRVNARATLQGDAWHSVEVVSVSENDVSPEVEQFTVLFRGSPGSGVAEGTYEVNAGGRPVSMHVQPAGADESGDYCVAVVSRLR